MSGSPKGTDARGRVGVVIGLTILAVAVLWHGLRPLAGYDLWWQLAMGRDALAGGGTLNVDTWSHTFAGKAWPYKDLGAGIVYWGTWQLGGAAGVVVLKALVFLGTAGLMWRVLRVRGVPPVLGLLLGSAVVVAVAFRFSERPQIFSFLVLALVLLVIERHRRGAGRLHWVGLLTLVNANLHRAALLIPILVAGYALACAIEGRASDDPAKRRATRDALAATLTCVAACLLTPFGFEIIGTSVSMVSDPALHSAIPEWWSASPEHLWGATPLTAGVIALIPLALALQGKAIRRVTPWDAILLVLALVVGFRGVRFLPYLSLLAAAPLGTLLARPPALAAVWNSPRKALISALAPAAALAAALTSDLPPPKLGLMEHRYPDAALSEVRAHPPRGALFNEFGVGGWLIFHAPEFPVFIDGRNDILYTPAFIRAYIEALGSGERLAELSEAHDLQWAMLDARPDDVSRAHFERSGWVAIHISQTAFVFVRGDGPNAELARERGYALLRPHEMSASIAFAARDPRLHERLLAETQRLVDEDPEGRFAHTARAKALVALGPAHAQDLQRELDWLRAHGLDI